VKTALILIDWGARHVKLLDDGSEQSGRVLVTRQMQVRALLPHSLRNLASDPILFHVNAEGSDDTLRQYTPAEAVIRDCYDAFLDGLEAFSNYVRTGLISIDSLRPYLQYWIDDIHAEAKDADEAAWSAALATYITFYRFEGVLWLFEKFGRNIGPSSASYKSFIANMADQELAQGLVRIANKKSRQQQL